MPDFAANMLESIMGWMMLGAVVVALWVGLSRGLKHGLLTFFVGIVLVGVLSGFVDDPEGSFGSAWEFIQSDVLGL